jgi:serine/threonine protein kinase
MLHGLVRVRFYGARKIARGGLGDHWLATDPGAAAVVLKTVREDFATDEVLCASFEREIALTARLDHRSLVHYVAHGRVEGASVMALEHIPGISLAELAATDVVPVAAAIAIAIDVAWALNYLTAVPRAPGASCAIVHGDVSPQNILVGLDGYARLIDFGGASEEGVASERPSMLVCKPGYVAPEQSRGDAIDCRTDQYALGIVLWELIAGRSLFGDDAVRRGRDIPPLSQFVNLRPGVEASTFRLLAFDPGARFASSSDAARSLSAEKTAPDARGWLARRARGARFTLRSDPLTQGSGRSVPTLPMGAPSRQRSSIAAE